MTSLRVEIYITQLVRNLSRLSENSHFDKNMTLKIVEIFMCFAHKSLEFGDPFHLKQKAQYN